MLEARLKNNDLGWAYVLISHTKKIPYVESMRWMESPQTEQLAHTRKSIFNSLEIFSIFHVSLSKATKIFSAFPSGWRWKTGGNIKPYQLTVLSISDCLRGKTLFLLLKTWKKRNVNEQNFIILVRRLSIGICTTNKSDCTTRSPSTHPNCALDFKNNPSVDECTWEAFWCLQKWLPGTELGSFAVVEVSLIRKITKKKWKLCAKKD